MSFALRPSPLSRHDGAYPTVTLILPEASPATTTLPPSSFSPSSTRYAHGTPPATTRPTFDIRRCTSAVPGSVHSKQAQQPSLSYLENATKKRLERHDMVNEIPPSCPIPPNIPLSVHEFDTIDIVCKTTADEGECRRAASCSSCLLHDLVYDGTCPHPSTTPSRRHDTTRRDTLLLAPPSPSPLAQHTSAASAPSAERLAKEVKEGCHRPHNTSSTRSFAQAAATHSDTPTSDHSTRARPTRILRGTTYKASSPIDERDRHPARPPSCASPFRRIQILAGRPLIGILHRSGESSRIEFQRWE
ncbi:hypothetical protein R3P38DRAFT_3177296 [Favolaschia claudopus]|uniref:Uncharacterized protein n=1 Tax=Favolaschia claudopus TaxID=2862362 RepID=A0AAW0D2C6_9AGAR